MTVIYECDGCGKQSQKSTILQTVKVSFVNSPNQSDFIWTADLCLPCLNRVKNSDPKKWPRQSPEVNDRANQIRQYLIEMDDELITRDGSCELSHEEAKKALRNVYLISKGDEPL